jgi:hypothetical protein
MTAKVGNSGTRPATKKFLDLDSSAMINTANAPSKHLRNSESTWRLDKMV